MSHCDTRVQIEVKNILSHKIFQIFSKQVFFKFQDYGMSFDKKKIFDGKIVPSPSIATRSQRQKLPFACYQRRRNLPVRIAWQRADAWVSHCDTRVQIEVKNILSHKIFQIFSKQVFFMFPDYGISLAKKKFLTKKNVLSPSIATRSQRQKLPFACYQRRRNLPVRIALQGGWSLGVSLRYESTNRGQKYSKSKIFGKTEK